MRTKLSAYVEGDESNRKTNQIYKHQFFPQFKKIEKSRDKESSETNVRIFLFFKHETKSSAPRYSFHNRDANEILNDRDFRTLQSDNKFVEGVHSIHVAENIFKELATYILTKTSVQLIRLYSRDLNRKEWRKEFELSPGNLLSIGDYIMKEREQDSVGYPKIMLIIKDKSRTTQNHTGFWGCCRCSTMQQFDLYWFHFIDNKEFSELESVMNQLHVRELLYSKKFGDENNAHFKNLLLKSNVSGRSIKMFKESPKIRDLLCEKSLKELNAKSEHEKKCITAAIASLAVDQELTSSTSLLGEIVLKQYQHSKFMKLDTSALTALNIIPNANETNKNASLAGLLKHTLTRMGDRRLMNWIRQPLVDIDQIKKRQMLVKFFLGAGEFEKPENLENEDGENIDEVFDEFSTWSDFVQSKFRGSPDLDTFVTKLMNEKVSLRDICKVYQFVGGLRELRYIFAKYLDIPVIKERFESWETVQESLSRFEALIEVAIDIEKLKDNEYFIANDRTVGIEKAAKKVKKSEKKMNKYMNELCSYLDIEGIGEKPKRKHIPKGLEDEYGYCIKLTGKGEFKKFNALKKKKREKKGIIEIKHNKNNVLVTDDNILHYALALREAKLKYMEEQKEEVNTLISVVVTFLEPFKDLIEEVALLDICRNFAELAKQNNWILPTIYEKERQFIHIKDGRHPCVEKTLDTASDFIKNDLLLSEGNFNDCKGPQLVIITGPNMGGKSTFIRQNALICLMSQIGCPVPASHAEISVRDGIFSRIGANDSQYDGVSTFMAEMVETSVILQSATKYSLLVIDELGRGTSTYEGFGLAWAICEQILDDLKSFCLFATHFHRLGELEAHRKISEFENPVKNFHVSYDRSSKSDRVTLLYQLEEGVCQESFGIEVTEKCNFPNAVIRSSKEGVKKLKEVYKEGNFVDFEGDESEKRRKRPRTIAYEYKKDVLHKFATAIIQEIKGGKNNDPGQFKESINHIKKQVFQFLGKEGDKNLEEAQKLVKKTIRDHREKFN